MLVAQNLSQVVESGGVGKTSYANESLTILNNVDLTILAGESVAIVGESGSGKSTLLGMLAGLDIPSQGRVCIDGHDLSLLDEAGRARIRQKYVAFVFQNFQLLPGLSAADNVALPMEVAGQKNAPKQARDFLDRVGLGHRSMHFPNQLSGGEQQRVALARAFACNAPIIFADEPTGNLDLRTGEKISDLLFEINQERQTTLVLVTHSLALAARCERTLTLHAGEIVNAKDHQANYA